MISAKFAHARKTLESYVKWWSRELNQNHSSGYAGLLVPPSIRANPKGIRTLTTVPGLKRHLSKVRMDSRSNIGLPAAAMTTMPLTRPVFGSMRNS